MFKLFNVILKDRRKIGENIGFYFIDKGLLFEYIKSY